MKRAVVIVVALLTLSLGAFANDAGAILTMNEGHPVHHDYGYHIKKGKKHHIQKKKAIREYLKAKKHYQVQKRKMKKAEQRFLRNHRKVNRLYHYR